LERHVGAGHARDSRPWGAPTKKGGPKAALYLHQTSILS
jgi:hypothetical protein